MSRIYHIYAKGECLYHSLNEQQFQDTWQQLQGMVGLMKTEYDEKDLSYRYSEVGKILDEKVELSETSVGLTD